MNCSPLPPSARKVLEQRECLDRAAGFRRDHEERVLELDLVLHLEDRVGVGRVEHVQVERVRWCAERPQRTSGARLDPPMPSSTASLKFSPTISRANATTRWPARASHRRYRATPGGRRSRACPGAPERLVVLPDAPRDLLVDRLPHALRDRARELRRDRAEITSGRPVSTPWRSFSIPARSLFIGVTNARCPDLAAPSSRRSCRSLPARALRAAASDPDRRCRLDMPALRDGQQGLHRIVLTCPARRGCRHRASPSRPGSSSRRAHNGRCTFAPAPASAAKRSLSKICL